MYDNPLRHLQDGPDDAPDPCETCGGNFEGVECSTLCDGCEGCPITGAPCHECTCPQTPPSYGEDEFCFHCYKLLGECKCSGGPTTIALAWAQSQQSRNEPPF